jgi:hypothetical protein
VNIRFIDEAQTEFFDAISGYEEARAGLGRRFKAEVDRCVLWVADRPELYRLRLGGYRRINVRAFTLHHPRRDAVDPCRGT